MRWNWSLEAFLYDTFIRNHGVTFGERTGYDTPLALFMIMIPGRNGRAMQVSCRYTGRWIIQGKAVTFVLGMFFIPEWEMHIRGYNCGYYAALLSTRKHHPLRPGHLPLTLLPLLNPHPAGDQWWRLRGGTDRRHRAALPDTMDLEATIEPAVPHALFRRSYHWTGGSVGALPKTGAELLNGTVRGSVWCLGTYVWLMASFGRKEGMTMKING